MHRLLRPDGLDLDSFQPHASSTPPHDHSTMSPSFSMMSVPMVNPEPAYIAASAASQIVTADYQNHYEEMFAGNEHTTGLETALVSPSSLSLVNAFLDRLLFNFLASAQSTGLAALKPAIVEVLKPRLAKEAIDGAEEELREFLEGGDDAEFESHRHRQEQQDAWDLELVWKRTRLRCMVYTRLGDMEEEDEEMYIAQEHLQDLSTSRRLSRDFGIVSPPVAIFLTSILEYIGEMALGIAGEAAYKRMDQRLRMGKQKPTGPQRLIVQEMDMEKVALNATLGRLWRSWRKLLRSPRTSISRVLSRDSGGYKGLRSFSSTSGSRRSSVTTSDGALYPGESDRTLSVAEVLSGSEPASIPLPFTDYDIAEIEVPGYCADAVPRSRDAGHGSHSNRAYSMIFPPPSDNTPSLQVTPRALPNLTERDDSHSNGQQKRLRRHQRSNSLPIPISSIFISPTERQEPAMESKADAERPEQIQATQSPSPVPEDDLTPHAENADITPKLSNSMADRLAERAKPISPPITPFQGSVLNAISKHAARELTPPNTSPEVEKSSISQPASITDQEDQMDEPKPQDSARLLAVNTDQQLEVQQTRYSSASSSRDFYGTGDVSPMEPTPVESGEVSPIDPPGNEHHSFLTTQQVHGQPLVTGNAHNGAIDGDATRNQSSEGVLMNVENVLVSPRSMQGRQRGMAGPTEDDYAKEEKREAFVVLGDVTADGSVRNSDASTLSGKDLQSDGTITITRARPTLVENPSPRTPLREFMDNKPSPTDGSSPRAASQLQSSPRAGRASVSSSVHSHAKHSSTASKGSDLRRQLPSVFTGADHDPAAVPQGSLSSIRHRDTSISHSRSSESSNREIRPTYVATTSAASPSSSKRRGHLASTSSDNTAPPRSSSGTSSSTQDEKQHKTGAQLDDTQRSFERLINSEETIQYTLTPHSMRELEGSEPLHTEPDHSPAVTTHVPGKVRSARTSMEQTTATPVRSVMGSIRGINGLRSSPITSVRSRSSSDQTAIATSKGQSLIIHSGPTVKRGPQPIARDARIENGTTRDFADFIRSTGPESLKSLPKLPDTIGSRPTTAINGYSRSSKSAQQPMSPRGFGKTATGSNAVVSTPPSGNKAPKRTGPRLQAREAAITRNDQSSDLIDFIRQGPQIDRSEGSHRIPRTIAPFRTTMDSDEISALGHSNAKSKDAISTASTQDSYISKSLRSSINSRTGLLDSTSRNNTKLSTTSTTKRDLFDDHPQPIRKQRRVRDPYAIDTDSEDEDPDSITPTAPHEESLLDFLNSVPPPTANMDPLPFTVPKSYTKTLQRKTSGPSMRSRFTRSASTTTPKSSTPASTLTKPPPPRGRSLTQAAHPTKPTHRPRPSSPHLVQHQPAGLFDAYRPTQPTYAAHRARKPAARDEHEAQNMDLTDLADFLKNSGPPEAAEAPVVGAGREREREREERPFRGIFSRRKRVGAA